MWVIYHLLMQPTIHSGQLESYVKVCTSFEKPNLGNPSRPFIRCPILCGSKFGWLAPSSRDTAAKEKFSRNPRAWLDDFVRHLPGGIHWLADGLNSCDPLIFIEKLMNFRRMSVETLASSTNLWYLRSLLYLQKTLAASLCESSTPIWKNKLSMFHFTILCLVR